MNSYRSFIRHLEHIYDCVWVWAGIICTGLSTWRLLAANGANSTNSANNSNSGDRANGNTAGRDGISAVTSKIKSKKVFYFEYNTFRYLSTNNQNWLQGVSVYCTVSVCERSLWAKTQQIHECVFVFLTCVYALYVWCASTYTISLLWNTCKNKARGQAQETKGERIKGGLVHSSAPPWTAPTSKETDSLSHRTHSH